MARRHRSSLLTVQTDTGGPPLRRGSKRRLATYSAKAFVSIPFSRQSGEHVLILQFPLLYSQGRWRREKRTRHDSIGHAFQLFQFLA